jgi:very-short-patch-repair endonuclease
MENVVTKRRDQINCDEEERLRLGYEIRTTVRFAERGGRSSYRIARIKKSGQDIALIYYGSAATLWRINFGWTRRRNKEQQGFILDIERGYWQKHDVERDTDGDPLSPRIIRVIPYVEDRKNCLILEFSSKHNERIIASIQAALKNAIQNCFELESSELAVEPLPDHNNRRSILFYEASEGGAGVLRKLVDDCDALPKVARIALELCHFNPDTGADLRHAPKSKENCEAACYDCLMSYTNQTDHQLLDRQLIKELLLDIANSNIESSPASKTRARHLQELMNLTGSKLECDWLQFLEDGNLRLPSHAQSLIEECQTRPDFVYREQQVAVYVDGPPHDYPDRKQRDQNQTNCMEDIGWTVIRFNVSEDWDQIIRRYPNIFGVYK